MNKPRKINLNNWEPAESEDDLKGYNGLIIIPRKTEGGIQLPSIYFRQERNAVPEIIDTDSAMWFRHCRISLLGEPEEYSKRIEWWYNNAMHDDEYKTILNDTFNRNGFDLKMSWEKSKNHLNMLNDSERKTYIHKFVWNWLSRGMSWQIRRLERDRQSQ